MELNGKYSMPYCADSGAEVSVIGRGHVQKLMEKDRSVKLMKIDKPVAAKTFGGYDLISSGQVNLSVKLHTAAGPMNMVEPVKCLVINEEDDEFILGKDFVAELGIDVDRQLKQLAENKDTVDDGPIGCNDDEAVGFDVDADLAKTIMKLVNAAIANGFQ